MDLLEVPVASASFQGGKPSRPLLPSARSPPPRDPASLAAGLCFPCILCFEQEDETRPDPCLALVLAGSSSHRWIRSSSVNFCQIHAQPSPRLAGDTPSPPPPCRASATPSPTSVVRAHENEASAKSCSFPCVDRVDRPRKASRASVGLEATPPTEP